MNMKIFAAIAAILATPALATDMTITSATGVQPSLSQQERNVLAAALSKADTGRVTVICGGAFCRAHRTRDRDMRGRVLPRAVR